MPGCLIVGSFGAQEDQIAGNLFVEYEIAFYNKLYNNVTPNLAGYCSFDPVDGNVYAFGSNTTLSEGNLNYQVSGNDLTLPKTSTVRAYIVSAQWFGPSTNVGAPYVASGGFVGCAP